MKPKNIMKHIENSPVLYTTNCLSVRANTSCDKMVQIRYTMPDTMPSASGISLFSFVNPYTSCQIRSDRSKQLKDTFFPKSFPESPFFSVYSAITGISEDVNRNPKIDIAIE